jgi:hypothetical protein
VLFVLAQQKPAEKKEAPRVLVVAPLGAAPGATTRLTVRGLKLDTATAIRFTDARITAKVLDKGKAALPDKQEPARVGDTQVQVEVTLPAGADGYRDGKAPFVVVTAAGDSEAHDLLVETVLPVLAEKEPNNSFRQAQAIQVPQVIDGAIAGAQDVDVFRFEGKAGQKIVAEVLAARHGSALDSILTLYDAAGRELASNDDSDGSSDSRLDVTLAKDGVYYLGLMDAHDQGGPAHVYRLVVRAP